MKNIIFFFVVSLSLFLVACGPKTRDERIADIIVRINNDPKWKDDIAKKAADWGQPLDSVIYRDAVWVVDQEDAKASK